MTHTAEIFRILLCCIIQIHLDICVPLIISFLRCLIVTFRNSIHLFSIDISGVYKDVYKYTDVPIHVHTGTHKSFVV